MYDDLIYIVDDHRLFGEGARSLLLATGYNRVEVLTGGKLLLRYLQTSSPQLVMLDITMEDSDGIELAALIRTNYPAVRILIVSMHATRIYIEKALQAGVDGYILKNGSDEDLKIAVASVLVGERHFPPVLGEMLLKGLMPSRTTPIMTLTPREKEILLLIAQGLSTKEMAARLFVSINTVETHRKNILFKTGLRNMAQLVKWGVDSGIFQN